jgi:hypothetical protein
VTTVETVDTAMDKVRENRLRRQARRVGLMLRKSRSWRPPNSLGEYGVLDPYTNVLVAGWDYDLSLNEAEAFLTEYGES